MKRYLYLISILIVLAWTVGCGGKDNSQKSDKSGKGDLETRVADLERRVAQLEGGGIESGRMNPGSQFMQANPRELSETPAAFEGKKIRFMGKLNSLNLGSNSLVVARGDSQVKVDLSALDDSYKSQLKDVKIDDQTSQRIVVMGTFQDGVLKAERIRLMRGGAFGGPGGMFGPGNQGGGNNQ